MRSVIAIPEHAAWKRIYKVLQEVMMCLKLLIQLLLLPCLLRTQDREYDQCDQHYADGEKEHSVFHHEVGNGILRFCRCCVFNNDVVNVTAGNRGNAFIQNREQPRIAGI